MVNLKKQKMQKKRKSELLVSRSYLGKVPAQMLLGSNEKYPNAASFGHADLGNI
jgi:hypothetical protein